MEHLCFAEGVGVLRGNWIIIWESLSSLRKLLQHECSLCPDAKPFNTFADLEQHMRKQHELFCCKLCVKHLKVSWASAWMCGKEGGFPP